MVLSTQLRIPGPTPLPERVVRASARPLINHRGPEFKELMESVERRMRQMLFTTQQVLFIAGSGTYGLEATVANLLSPGDTAIFCSCGYFGERWLSIAASYGVKSVAVESPWGQPTTPSQIEEALASHPEAKAVFITHNETSTGVTNDIEELARVVKNHGVLLAIDSVSGAGSLPVRFDDLRADVLVTATQKGWMAPPGLSMIAVTDAALEASSRSTSPTWSLSFEKHVASASKGMTPTTPPVTVFYALNEGLAMIEEEGIEQAWNRHAKIATMIRTGVVATGLKLFAPEPYRSNSVTAIHSPTDSAEGLSTLLSLLRKKYGLVLAGGQGPMTGKIFRIGHLGYIDENDAYAILAALEQGMFELGYLSRVGFAVAAAQSAANTWAFGQELVAVEV